MDILNYSSETRNSEILSRFTFDVSRLPIALPHKNHNKPTYHSSNIYEIIYTFSNIRRRLPNGYFSYWSGIYYPNNGIHPTAADQFWICDPDFDFIGYCRSAERMAHYCRY
jgi:hypothetical protein